MLTMVSKDDAINFEFYFPTLSSEKIDKGKLCSILPKLHATSKLAQSFKVHGAFIVGPRD